MMAGRENFPCVTKITVEWEDAVVGFEYTVAVPDRIRQHLITDLTDIIMLMS